MVTYRPRPFLRVATAVGALLLTVAPVVLHNVGEVGRPMIASSARFNLWVGLQDRSTRNFEDPVVGREFLEWRRSGTSFEERERVLEAKIRRHVEERGALRVLSEQAAKQFRRLLAADSFLTDQLPGGAIHARGGGYVGTLSALASLIRTAHRGGYALLLTGFAFGLAFSWRRWQSWMDLPALFLAYNLAIFLVLHVKTRYRIQMLPALLVFAAFGIMTILDRGCDPESLRPGWVEYLVGTLVALGLLATAF